MTGDGDAPIYNVWVIELETLAVNPVSVKGLGCMQWAADSNTLYFFLHTIYGDPGFLLRAIAVDDGQSVDLTESFDAAGTQLSPDTRNLAYHLVIGTQAPLQNEGDSIQFIYTFPSELIIQNTATLAQTTIPVGDVMLDLSTDLVWSPDGTHLFFSGHCDESTTGLWSAEIETQAIERVVDCRDGRLEQPQVSPDGSRVLFRADWDGGWNIYVLDAATTSVRNLTGG
jgi:Tol biopolymer transport system component